MSETAREAVLDAAAAVYRASLADRASGWDLLLVTQGLVSDTLLESGSSDSYCEALAGLLEAQRQFILETQARLLRPQPPEGMLTAQGVAALGGRAALDAANRG